MKVIKFIMTIALEFVGIYLFSKAVGWSFMETFFLGSMAIFGIIWLVALSMNRNANMDHALYKGVSGVDTGEVKPFQIILSPYIIGTISLVAISLITSIIYYSPYFT
ncbi:hypothetical protein CN354_07660 [Bacillus cereus]|uniref:hypothetical protein n=1 Tax=Bacillus pseudomycoides TaxID=64104 RepID=UPI000BF64AD6|nr:hypothetical protein [Bacillus pseudomycoides]PEY41672.1 hypothetical protein CN354_07660 [Bacillus cereus]WJE51661.1 hypothetical protein QRE66_20560 [Bacillus cereus]